MNNLQIAALIGGGILMVSIIGSVIWIVRWTFGETKEQKCRKDNQTAPEEDKK